MPDLEQLPMLASEILESLPVAILVVDAGQRICWINLEAERLFGYRREDLLGRTLEPLLPESLHAHHTGWMQGFMLDPSARAMGANRDLMAKKSDGTQFPVEIALNPIRTDASLYVAVTVVDLSARKALERRVLADQAELERLVRQRTAELERSISEQRAIVHRLEATQTSLERLTREDPLTGLANRRDFDAQLARAHDRATRRNQPLTVAMLDLDHFKRVNDRFGHLIGDEVLRQVAGILRRQCRSADLPARYGGEEFVIALPDSTLAEAALLCERIRASVQAQDWASIQPGLSMTISIGAAMRQAGETAQALVERADRCLYRAKRAGRNQVAMSSG